MLLNTGSMHSFNSGIIADKLQLKLIQKEKLSVFIFKNKMPIQKIYHVELKLKNKHFSNSRVDIEKH